MKENSLLIKVFLCFGILFQVKGINLLDNDEENSVDRWTSDRDPRFFRLRIPADNCSSAITGYDEGYCDGFASCLANLGVLSGVCSNLLGLCCVVKKSCGASIVSRVAYFRNRKYPETTSAFGVCSVTIAKYISDVVQIRIDFLDFVLAKPINGNCPPTEFFSVSGGDSRFVIPRVCGINTGQHMYVNFATTGNITLNFNIAGNPGTKFNLKITQYRANHPEKAPDGCLQYFLTNRGTVTSFNYDNGNGPHINSHRYDICVRRIGPSSEIVTWTLDDLRIASTPTVNGDACVSTMQDYINISGGTSGTPTVAHNAYCASNLNGLVVKASTSKIEVVFNAMETGETSPLGTTGFKFSFSLGQRPNP